MKVNYKYIGWYSEDNSDKVWACIQLPGGEWYKKFLTVWGRRGKKLQSKLIETSVSEMEKLIRSKNSKGYREIPQDRLTEVYPEFEQDLEKTAAWSMLMA
jgi:predicted DNA-binding WGR domain protein